MTGTHNIRYVSAGEDSAWDRMVCDSPHGTLFHTSAWRDVVEGGYGRGSWIRLGCYENEQLTGGYAALLRRRIGVAGAVMPLLTPYSGFVLNRVEGEKFSDRASRQGEVLRVLATGAEACFGRENLVLAPGLEDPRPLVEFGYRLTPRFTFHLDLQTSPQQLWSRLDGHVRRQIKKGERASFTSGELDPEEAWVLFRRLFERRGGESCPVPRALFDAVVAGQSLQNSRRIWTATDHGRLVSFIVALQFRATVYYAVAATDENALGTGVSSWLIWKMLETLAGEQAWETFDFLGANIPSIARFKEGFNPRLVTHWRAERSHGAGRAVEWLAKFNR